PLCDRAMAILEEMAAIRANGFVFPGQNGEMVGTSLRRVLAVMGRQGITVHGFRSAFSDWSAERTAFPSEVREMALAHAIGNKVEEAYRRGDLFEKRRRLAEAWADYLAPQSGGSVVSLRGT